MLYIFKKNLEAFRSGHHGLWHHWHFTGSNNGSKSGLLIITLFGSYVHKGMREVNFFGDFFSNGDKIKVKFKWIVFYRLIFFQNKKFNKSCNCKMKYVLGYAPLWLHHKIEKKRLDKGASCQAQGMELDEAKFSLEKPM